MESSFVSILYALLSILAIIVGFSTLFLLVAYCQHRVTEIRKLAINPMHNDVYDN